MGFDPNTAIFFSGIGTLIFFVCVRGRVPSYLGSSFSFIAVVVAAEAISGWGRTQHRRPWAASSPAAPSTPSSASIVMAVGYKWVEWLMPPVITGAIVMVIGLNLAHVAVAT
jgi:putative pyrimidine permease RutG